jgi:hypothetical protein
VPHLSCVVFLVMVALVRMDVHFSNLLGRQKHLIDAISGDNLSLGHRICNDSKKKRNGNSYSYLIASLLHFSSLILLSCNLCPNFQLFLSYNVYPAPKIKFPLFFKKKKKNSPLFLLFIPSYFTSSFFKRILGKFY